MIRQIDKNKLHPNKKTLSLKKEINEGEEK